LTGELITDHYLAKRIEITVKQVKFLVRNILAFSKDTFCEKESIGLIESFTGSEIIKRTWSYW